MAGSVPGWRTTTTFSSLSAPEAALGILFLNPGTKGPDGVCRLRG
jgi:hypothetical protein